MDKKKADQQASPKHSNVNDTNKHAQLARLLARLQKGPVSTIDARRELNIMAPAARVKELRDGGIPVLTHLRDLHDDQGRYHSRVAVYYLSDQLDGKCLTFLNIGLKSEQETRAIAAQYIGDIRIDCCSVFD